MSFNEVIQHGKTDFPFQIYYLDKAHPRYEMVFHWHNFIEVIKVHTGTLRLVLNNKTYIAKAGDVFIINPDVVHGATPTDCTYTCFLFNPEFLKNGNTQLDSFIDGLIGHSHFIHTRVKNPDLINHIDRIIDAMSAPKVGYEFNVIGNVLLAFYNIIDKNLFSLSPTKFFENEKTVNKLKSILSYIRENFNSEISLQDMANVVGFTTKYFCQYFKKMTGKTPIDYLISFRIEWASRKLVETDESITSIAYSCGFNDTSFFIRTFRRLKNTTPKEYRCGI